MWTLHKRLPLSCTPAPRGTHHRAHLPCGCTFVPAVPLPLPPPPLSPFPDSTQGQVPQPSRKPPPLPALLEAGTLGPPLHLSCDSGHWPGRGSFPSLPGLPGAQHFQPGMAFVHAERSQDTQPEHRGHSFSKCLWNWTQKEELGGATGGSFQGHGWSPSCPVPHLPGKEQGQEARERALPALSPMNTL